MASELAKYGLGSMLFSLSTEWVYFSLKFDRPNPFCANLGTFVSQLYMAGFYFLTEPELTADRAQVEYRLSFATVVAQ